MMVKLSQLLPQNNILLDLSVLDKRSLFRELGDLFQASDNIESKEVYDALYQREEAGSTGLGCGVAVPHGRIAKLVDATAAFIRLAEPMPFGAPDGQPVNLIIALLMPHNVTDIHLEILSDIAAHFSNSDFRQKILKANSAKEIAQLLAE